MENLNEDEAPRRETSMLGLSELYTGILLNR
jgi:hypothetical protein